MDAQASSSEPMPIVEYLKWAERSIDEHEKKLISIRENLAEVKKLSLKEGDFVMLKNSNRKGMLLGVILGTNEMKIPMSKVDKFLAQVVTIKGMEYLEFDEFVPYTVSSKLLYEKS